MVGWVGIIAIDEISKFPQHFWLRYNKEWFSYLVATRIDDKASADAGHDGDHDDQRNEPRNGRRIVVVLSTDKDIRFSFSEGGRFQLAFGLHLISSSEITKLDS